MVYPSDAYGSNIEADAAAAELLLFTCAARRKNSKYFSEFTLAYTARLKMLLVVNDVNATL